MTDKEIKRRVNELLRDSSLKQVNYDNLVDALDHLGYDVVEFNRYVLDPMVEVLIDALDLSEQIKNNRGFTYAGTDQRIIFIDEKLSDHEKLIVLAHETGHICCDHMGSSYVLGRDVSEEYEANRFASLLLNPPGFSFELNTKLLVRASLVVLVCMVLVLGGVVIYMWGAGAFDKSEQDLYSFANPSENKLLVPETIEMEPVTAEQEATLPTSTEESTEYVTESMTEVDTISVTESVTIPVTEPVTVPVTEPITEPVIIPVTVPVTIPVTVPATEPVTVPVTEPVTVPVTEPPTEPVTQAPIVYPVTGTYGTINYYMDEDGTLTLTGTGSLGCETYLGTYDYPEMSFDLLRSSNKSLVLPIGLAEGTRINDKEYFPKFRQFIETDKVKKVIIGEGITDIPDYCFACMPVSSVSLPSTITYIGKSAFYRSKITEIVIPGAVKEIGRFAFTNSELRKVYFEEGIETIGAGSFSEVYMLSEVTIAESVKYIEEYAFEACFVLEKVSGTEKRLRSRINTVNILGEALFYSNNFQYADRLIFSNPSSTAVYFYTGGDTILGNPDIIILDYDKTPEDFGWTPSDSKPAYEPF